MTFTENSTTEYNELIRAGYKYIEGTPLPQPISKPKFTLSELKAAVPSHCFERSLVTSFGHLALNLLILGSCFYAAYFLFELHSLPLLLTVPGYLAYWFVQGAYLMGLWVLAHECGHQAFSEIPIVNDIVGLTIHSALFTPYFSWQITHRRHHSNNGSCENDEVWVPASYSHAKEHWPEYLEDSPMYSLVNLIGMCVVGWMPGYLLFNMAGPKKNSGLPKSHFNPNASFFSPEERLSIVISDVGIFVALVTLTYFINTYGFFLVLKLHLMPYLSLNTWLVLITYLHHTHPFVPHYREGEWSWLRGALCTADRSFGAWIDSAVHHISDTHICHHIFSKMPFYHCQEATEAIKPILGDYYLMDKSSAIDAIWRSITNCKYVPDDGKVVFYQGSVKHKEI